MAVHAKLEVDSDEFALGLCFSDGILMAYVFWKTDLTLEGETEPELSFEQRLFFCDESQKLLLCCGRKLGKSILLESRILRIAVAHTDTGSRVEGLITTPSQKQMKLLYSRVMGKFHQDPLIMSLIKRETGGDDVTTQFRNNFVWMWRLEGLSGKDTNMTGIRAAHILGDEQQGSNQVCNDSRKMSALPGCTFLYCGVPDGVRSTPFFQVDQTHMGDGWSRHNYSSFINPIFRAEEERKRMAHDYGGLNSIAYAMYVLGKWGDAFISSFPPGTIASQPNLPVFIKEYNHDLVSPYAIQDAYNILFGDITRVRCHSYACGIDYGATNDPTVMTWAYRTTAISSWYQYARLTFNAIEFPHLVKSIEFIMKNVFTGYLVGLCSDHIALIQSLTNDFGESPESRRIYIANAGGTTALVDSMGNQKKDGDGKPLKIRNKQYYHELLRSYMINANLNLEGVKLWISDDDIVLIEELRGTTERKTPGGYTEYYSAQMLRGGYIDHNRESSTYLAAAIDLGLQVDDNRFTESQMIEELGFAGGTGEGNARMPWEYGKAETSF